VDTRRFEAAPAGTGRTSSKPRLTTRRLSSTTRAPLAPNFFFSCSWIASEQGRLVSFGVLHHRRRGEEGALERDALHAQDCSSDVRRLFAGDLERVDGEDLDVLLLDLLLVGRRDDIPDFLGGSGRSG
jgi:hypothetical protein